MFALKGRLICCIPTIAIASIFLLMATPRADAQTLSFLHSFTTGPDGNTPFGGPAFDSAGNIYAATCYGGSGGRGTVVRLTKRNGAWITQLLHSFSGGDDGNCPMSNVTIGPDGRVYGTTLQGGGGCSPDGCGTVFQLTPPPRPCPQTQCPWTAKIIYRFADSPEQLANPFSWVTFDAAGNLYGTTSHGGNCDICGVVFKLTPSGGNTWTPSVIYEFTGGTDGSFPYAGLTIDAAGNLYGTTYAGSVYELVRNGAGWTETTLYTFTYGADGGMPQAGVVFDNAGNLYGATTVVNSDDIGGVFYKLTHSGSTWTFSILYTYPLSGIYGNVALDNAGNIYASAQDGGSQRVGAVLKLTNAGGVYSVTDLHDFGGLGWPQGDVLLDAAGNLYGTTLGEGQHGEGSVWQIQF
jgi:uncharacterized repeat protein (TIGR03803 family)